MAIIEQRMTLEAFLKLSEKKPALEFEDGVVTQKVSPQGRHSRLQVKVTERVNAFAEPRRLAVAFTELRTTYAGYSRVPDISVYRWDRIPVDATGRVLDEFHLPPDIVIEIISPGQRTNALRRRCIWYVEHGVPIALLLDPPDESIALFRPHQAPISLKGGDPVDLTEVLPGFAVTVQEIFADLTFHL
jgi:Uma2 family endonuclease